MCVRAGDGAGDCDRECDQEWDRMGVWYGQKLEYGIY